MLFHSTDTTSPSPRLQACPTSSLRSVSFRSYLYHLGNKAEVGYRLHDGLVLLCRVSATGRRIGFALVTSGETFGEEACYGVPRYHDAWAIEPSTVEMLDPSEVSSRLGSQKYQLARDARERARRLEELCCVHGLKKRIAWVLRNNPRVHLPQFVIAALCHSTREAVARFLSQKARIKR